MTGTGRGPILRNYDIGSISCGVQNVEEKSGPPVFRSKLRHWTSDCQPWDLGNELPACLLFHSKVNNLASDTTHSFTCHQTRAIPTFTPQPQTTCWPVPIEGWPGWVDWVPRSQFNVICVVELTEYQLKTFYFLSEQVVMTDKSIVWSDEVCD